MQHIYDPSTYKCTACGAGIYTTGMDDCPGRPNQTKPEETLQERIWKAIQDSGR